MSKGGGSQRHLSGQKSEEKVSPPACRHPARKWQRQARKGGVAVPSPKAEYTRRRKAPLPIVLCLARALSQLPMASRNNKNSKIQLALAASKRARAAPAEQNIFDRTNACTDLSELIKIIKDNPLDPKMAITHEIICRELAFQAKHIKLYAKQHCVSNEVKWVRKRTLWRALAPNISAAAIKLLPMVAHKADYFLAFCRGNVNTKRVAPPNERVNIGTDDDPQLVSTHDVATAPMHPAEIRTGVALSEEKGNEDGIPRHVEYCKQYAEDMGLDPDIFDYGDRFFVPCNISAPMRKGKTDVSLLVLWFDLRLGFRCTYGVAPKKSNVIMPVWKRLMSMQWHNPEFNLLVKPCATYQHDANFDLTMRARSATSVVGEVDSNFLIYSIDERNDAQAAYEFIKSSCGSLEITRPFPTCANSEVTVKIDYANQTGRPCSNLRDEVQNAAKTGAEEKKEKLQKKAEELRNARKNIKEVSLKMASAQEDEREQAKQQALARLSKAQSALENANKVFEKAKNDIMAYLRPAFANSMGVSTNITATILPTFTEIQMYGTAYIDDLPLGMKFEMSDDPEEKKKGILQSVQVIPALTPNSDTFYKGFNAATPVDYNGTSYTKDVVYERYKREFKNYLEESVNCAANDEERAAARADLSQWTSLLVSKESPLFASGSFGRPDMLKLNGSKSAKATAKSMVDVAKFLTYIDFVVIGQPRESRVIPGSEHAPSEPDAPSILPTTVVMITDKITPRSKYGATQLTAAKRIVETLISRNETGVVAVWGSDTTKANILREFPESKFGTDFASDFTSNQSRNVAVFHVRQSTSSDGVRQRTSLQTISANVDDFAQVVDRLAHSTPSKELEKTNIFVVGYQMFTGAITLTTTLERADDGEPDLVVCPQHIIYAHTMYRQIDAKCQSIGRGFNDFSFHTNFGISLLSHEHTSRQGADYMKAEQKFVSATQEIEKCNVAEDGEEPRYETVFNSLHYCVTAASAQLQASSQWGGEGQKDLAANGLGLKARKMKNRATLQSVIAEHFDASLYTGDLDDMSDDEVVEENALEEANAPLFGFLPESERVPGIPYLYSCAIVWLREQLRARSKLATTTQHNYIRGFIEVLSSREFNEHGGWKEHLAFRPKTNDDRAEFNERVIQPFMDAHHPGSQSRDWKAGFWKLFSFFPSDRDISDATPIDFGYLPLETESPSGSMNSDPDYVPW